MIDNVMQIDKLFLDLNTVSHSFHTRLFFRVHYFFFCIHKFQDV